jgi:hypothetical protein
MRDNDHTYRRIWTDARTGGVLRIYRHGPFGGTPVWNAQVERLNPGAAFMPRPGELVVFFDTERGQICPYCWSHARKVWGDTSGNRPGWRLVFATDDRVVRAYAVG